LAQYDINLREYWRILKKRKFIVLFVGIVLGVFSTAFAFLKAPTPVYTSECSIKFEKETTVEGLYAKTITWSGADDIETQVSVMKSFTIFEEVAQRLGLIPKTTMPADSPAKGNVARVVDDLQSKVEVTRQGMTNILNIRVKDTDPASAQTLANTVASTYKDLHSELQMKRTLEAIRYIEDQLVQVRQKLREAEEEFNRFTQSNQLLSIDIQSEKLLAGSQEVQKTVRKLAENRGELQNVVARLDKFIANPSVQGNFYTATATTQYQAANDALTELQLRRDTLLKDFTPLHPEVVDVARKIVEDARKMRLLLLAQIGDLEKQEEDARSEQKELESKSSALMEKKLEYDRLKRKVELYNDMTTLLERKNQEALIKKAEKPEEVTVVKPALFPMEPVNPPKTATTGAMGLIIGLVLGLIAAFVVETFDTSIGAIEDVEETLKTRVLGVIPQADAKELYEAFKDKLPGEMGAVSPVQMVNMVAHYVPKSMMAESFRGLRTNIQFKDAVDEIKTLAITSASPQEGKTIVSVNLAITMAQAGMKILLIGSDMRKPMIARIFGIEQTPGLSEILLGNCPWQDAVQTVTDMIVGKMSLEEVLLTPGLDNLHLIPAGSIPPNPAELMESKHLKEFVEEAKDEYELLLFDSPPILSTADAVILGSKMDGVLLDYRVGTVSRGLLKRATAQLEQVNTRIIGVILNGVTAQVCPDFPYYYHTRYRYYYGDGRNGKKRTVKKNLSMFDTRDINLRSLKGSPSDTVTVRATEGWRKWEKTAGLPLMIVTGLFLAGGLLWQNHVLNFLTWNQMDPARMKQEVKIPIKEVPVPPIPADAKAPASTSPTKVEPKALPREAEATPQQAPEQEKIVKVVPSKEDLPVLAPPIPSAEIKTGSSIAAPSRAEPVERPEQKPPTEEPKAESSTLVEVASARAIEASKTPETKAGPQSEPLRVAAVPPQEIEANKTPDTKEKPKADSTPAGSSPIVTYPFSLRLGSVPYLDLAEKGVSKYTRNGLPVVYYSEVAISRGIWYRLYTGYFESEEQAEGFKREKRLEKAEVVKTPFTNLIGTFTSEDELESKSQSLKSLGFSPYVIKDADGKQRLVVGAFYNEERAQRQYRELKSRGIENQIVQR
jgi:succinoglycan biosynthesis transport protein ExoP